MEQKDTGKLLVAKDIKLHRKWFTQMTQLLGINVIYRQPKEGKHWDLHGELDSFYEAPILVGCIFNDNVDQKTMKKLGWNVERSESTSVIHVPYNLPGIQAGALFIIPSGLDKTEGRLFRVLDMRVSPVYPASIACELGPVLANNMPLSQTKDFTHTDIGILDLPDDGD